MKEMSMYETDEFLKRNFPIGSRIQLINMNDDPDPIESGTKGTVVHIGGGQLNVDWDNGRKLGVIYGVDDFMAIQ